ncbi:MAG: hypothetical protein ABI461_05615 [Polyangiaceae bacterium]
MSRRAAFLAGFVIAAGCGGASANAPNAPSNSAGKAQSGSGNSFGSTNANAVTQLDCGDFHNCARMGDGSVACWGRNRDGELGDGGGSGDSSRPRKVEGLVGVAEVAVGSNFSCARLGTGNVMCWGSGKILNDGRDLQKQKPAPVNDIHDVVELDAGGYVVCARMASGAAKCWGLDAVDRGAPTSNVIHVTAAGAHACVLMKDGSIKCWGEGAWAPNAKVSFANPSISAATAISSGDSFACALSGAGLVTCFGRNEQGELGANPDEDNHAAPLAVRSVKSAKSIASAESHTCAVLQDGTVSCWGSNTEGELGRGTTTTQELAAPVNGISGVVTVVPGADHVCAHLNDGSVSCWGNNKYGQIGDGTQEVRLTPVKTTF